MDSAKFKPFDAADYLNSEEDIADFLATVIEEADGDQSLIDRGQDAAARASARLAAQAH